MVSESNSDSTEETYTVEEIAATVYQLHDSMDEIKSWSVDTTRALEHAVEELTAEGEGERAEGLIDLMVLVNTLYRRLTQREEESLIPLTELR
ncbi:hypothetical protein [Halobellus limi]|uniref:Uncharacterized protein n=1 Tax=Halobellus limi TaxID=699433 RepID=A0A1H5ZET1_9EURY|nr:hypothetical protein [Halobellus limi]QCC48126.1 hypothetical protein DV707_10885 [Halobellus limi]SEG34590.1 hypothetical protein SAMN04488133_1960 [Halobellus limi]